MATEEQGAETSAREGAFSRVIGALVSPRATFESIARKPGWLLPVLLILLLNVLLVFSFSYRVGWRTTIERQIASNPRYAQMTPLQQQQAIARGARIAPIAGYIGSTVGTLLVLLAMAGIFLGAFNIVFGTGIKFRQSFSIAVYAFMPGLVKGLVALLIVWVRPPEGVSMQNLVMSNVGAFLPAGAPAWLTTLGASLDVFTVWIIVLLAIGYSIATARKVRFGSALAVVVSLWLVFLLALVGFTALFG